MERAGLDRRLLTEVLSAIAVVMSLVFVGLEVRESSRQTELNTQSLQVTAYQDLIAQINEINALSMASPQVGVLVAGATTFSNLSEIEAEQVFSSLMLVARHGDMAFYQYELGMLTEDRLESALSVLSNTSCFPIFEEFWASTKDNFVEGYREYLDDKISTMDCSRYR